MPLNLTQYDNLLKEFYEPPVRDTLNNEIPLFRILDQSDKEWSGRRVVFPVKTSRNSGVGARAENGTLPTAGNQGYQLSVVSATYQYGRIQVSGPAIASGKNAFVAAMSSEMEGLVNDLKVDLGRQSWGTGDGRLCQVAADSNSSTSVTVYNRFVTGFAQMGQPGARFISEGMLLAAGTLANFEAQTSGVTVSAVSLSTTPATTADTINITASSLNFSQCDTFLFVAGAGGAGREMMGVQALVDEFSQANYWGSNAFYSGSVQGISRATTSRWNAIVLANSGSERLIDSNLIQTAFDKIHIESGLEPDLIMGEHGVVRAFLDSVAADRRYVASGAPSYDAGFSKLSYNGVAIERDRMAPYASLLVAKKDCLKMYTLLDFQWADDDGSILSRVSNTDAWEAFFKTYRNIGIDGNPKGLCMIRDIRVDL